jgi:hypothetical protein
MAESQVESVSLDSGLSAWVAAIREQPQLLRALNQITPETAESVADYIAQLTIEGLDDATRQRIHASLSKIGTGEVIDLAGAVLTFFSLLPAEIPLGTALSTLVDTGDLQPELLAPAVERLSLIFERGNVPFERALLKSMAGPKLASVTPAKVVGASGAPPVADDTLIREESFDAVVQEWADSDALIVVSAPDGATERRLMARDRLARAGVRRVGAHFKIAVRERRLSCGTRVETDLLPITGALEIRQAVPNLDPSMFSRK